MLNRRWLRGYLLAFGTCATTLVTFQAKAYTVNAPLLDGCHESMTFEALRRARSLLPANVDEVRLATGTRDELALRGDVPFRVPHGMDDLSAITLVLANRDVDLQGVEPGDLDQIATVHGNPLFQNHHCLRHPNDDGLAGNLAAITACRGFIRAEMTAALAGLTEDGRVDPTQVTEFKPVLDIRGPVKIAMPTLQVRLGRAVHAVQDSFSHAYRTPDGRRIKTTVNYLDPIEGGYDEELDGPPHSIGLDRCTGLDSRRQEILEFATEASAAFLGVALAPGVQREAKVVQVEELLDRYFTAEPDCVLANQWCQASERGYDVAGWGCTIGVDGTRTTSRECSFPLGLGGLLFLFGLVRRGRRVPLRWVVTCAVVLGLVGCVAGVAAAADLDVSGGAKKTVERRIEEPPVVKRPEFGYFVSVAAAVHETAAAVSLGLRYRLGDHYIVGLDGEWNPWISSTTNDVRSGAINAYGTLIARIPLSYQRVNLRSTLNFGASRILFDLYGVPSGTTGLFVGVNFLGIDWEITPSFYLVVDPAYIAVPIPQLDGVPFSFPQYRFRIGLQWGA